MQLKGKKVIILGERDGIQGQAIAACVKSAGAEPLLVQTQCFVWTAAGALDLEGQESIKKVVEQYGKDDLIVIIGAPDADSAELYAETVTHGDPTWAGPLAGVALELPVFHIMEPEITTQIDPAVYKEHLSIMDIALDVKKITQGLNRVRGKSG
jgi:glycine/sarcosine/betaine reductase complex component A